MMTAVTSAGARFADSVDVGVRLATACLSQLPLDEATDDGIVIGSLSVGLVDLVWRSRPWGG